MFLVARRPRRDGESLEAEHVDEDGAIDRGAGGLQNADDREFLFMHVCPGARSVNDLDLFADLRAGFRGGDGPHDGLEMVRQS